MSITFHNVHKTLRQKTKKTRIFESSFVEFDGTRINGVLASAGSGKTTAVQLVTGKINPDRGVVKRSSLVSYPIASGGIFHGLLTGRENLAFLCRVFGFDPKLVTGFVAEFTELGKALDKPLRLFTREERTRLMFASSYALPFDTYVADETLIGGRGSFRDRCEELVRQRMQTAGFVIYSSSPALLKKYCNQFYVLHKLDVHPVGSVEEAATLLGNDRLRDGDGSVETAGGHDSEEADSDERL